MNFPLINITFRDWNELEAGNFIFEIFLDNKYVYTSNEKLFKRVYLDCDFVDMKGDIYKVVGKRSKLWRRLVPFMYKAEMIFQKTDRVISLEAVKDILVGNINSLDLPGNVKDQMVNDIKTVSQYSELGNLYMK